MNAVADFISKNTVTEFWLGVCLLLLGLGLLTGLRKLLTTGNGRMLVLVGMLASGMLLMGESGYAEEDKDKPRESPKTNPTNSPDKDKAQPSPSICGPGSPINPFPPGHPEDPCPDD